MTNLDIGVWGVVATLALLMFRVPIGVALGSVAIVGMAVTHGAAVSLGIVKAVPYELIGDWNFSAIPMFLLMGLIASNCDLTKGLFQAARIYFGRVPGGLASGTVVTSAMFAAASGSSVATASAFSRIAVPEMLRSKYDPGFATACVAMAGTLGALIPPSLIMIIYGIMMSASIADLFLAGVVPGILSAFMFILYISARAMINPALAPPSDVKAFSRQEKAEALRDIWPLPLIIVGVVGGIFLGVFNPTEAGAVGAALVCVIAMLKRKLSVATFLESLSLTVRSTASIFIIIVGAALFQRFMALTGVPAEAAIWMTSYADNQIEVLLLISLIYLILGMFLDSISLMLLTLPILMPVLQNFGIDLIWFGIIVVKLLEIGLVTPPLGMNVFVIKASMGNTIRTGAIFKGVAGFLVVDLVTLGLLIAFPLISLWLPANMVR